MNNLGSLLLVVCCFLHQTSGQIEKWSECSRTCGGGVRRLINGCLQYGPDSECLSYNSSYVSCNTQSCPPGTTDFRTHQCEKYEKKPLFGKLYKLEAYISASSGAKCELYCRTKGDKFYLKFSDTVLDGTPCGPDLSGICVENVCKAVGCDRELGSKKRFDECMVCGGDGSSCTKHSKIINLNVFKGAGYHKLLTLPKGATSINIENPEGGNRTFIALTNEEGEYQLNGHYRVANSRTIRVGGIHFNYTRVPESLTSRGPISEAIVVMALVTSQTDAPVSIDFHLPVVAAKKIDAEFSTGEGGFLEADESSYKEDEPGAEGRERGEHGEGGTEEFVTFAEDLPQFRTNQFFAGRSNPAWKLAGGKSSGALETKVESGDMKASGDGDDEEESSSGESPDEEIHITEKASIMDLENENKEKPEDSKEEEEEEEEEDHDEKESGAEVTTETTTEVTSGDDDDDEDDTATKETDSPTSSGKDDEDSGKDKEVKKDKNGSGEDEDDDEDGVEEKVKEDEDKEQVEVKVKEDEDKEQVEEEDDDDDDDEEEEEDKDKVEEEDDDDDKEKEDDDDKKIDEDKDVKTDKSGSGHDDEDEKVVEEDDDDEETVVKEDDDDEKVEEEDDDDEEKVEEEDDDDDEEAVKEDDDEEKVEEEDDDDKEKVEEDKDVKTDKSGSGQDNDDDDEDKEKVEEEDDDEVKEKVEEEDDDDDEEAVVKEDDDKEKVEEDKDVKTDKSGSGQDNDDDDDDDDDKEKVEEEDDDEDKEKVEEEDDDDDDDGQEETKVSGNEEDKDKEEETTATPAEKDEDDDDDDDDEVKKGSGDEITKVVVKPVEAEKEENEEDDDDDDDKKDDDDEVSKEGKGDEDDATEKRVSGDDDDDDDADEKQSGVEHKEVVKEEEKEEGKEEEKEEEQSTTLATSARFSGHQAKDDDDDDDDDDESYYDYDDDVTTASKETKKVPPRLIDDDDDDDEQSQSGKKEGSGDDDVSKKGSGDDRGDDDDDDDDKGTDKDTTDAVTTIKPKDEDDDDDYDDRTRSEDKEDEVDEITTQKATTVKREDKKDDDDDDDDDDDVAKRGSGSGVTTERGSADDKGDDDDDDGDDDDDVTRKGSGDVEDSKTTHPPPTEAITTAGHLATDETESPRVSDGEVPEVTTAPFVPKEDEEDDDEDGTTESTASGSGSGEGSGLIKATTIKESHVSRQEATTETTTDDVIVIEETEGATTEAEAEATTRETGTVEPEVEEEDETTPSEGISVEPTSVETTPHPSADTLTPRPITPPEEEEKEKEEEKEEEEEKEREKEKEKEEEKEEEVKKEEGLEVEKESEVPVESVEVDDYDGHTEVEEVSPPVTGTCDGDEFGVYQEQIIKEKSTRWYVGFWGECLDGRQRREVLCVVYDDNDNMTITSNMERCFPPKPFASRRCKTEAEEALVFIEDTRVKACHGDLCRHYEWITSDWVGCSSSCEEEFDTRLVLCSERTDTEQGLIVPEDKCHGLDRPDGRRECHRQEIACELKPKWFSTEWGECSTKCGVGTQTRRVFCGKVLRQTVGDTILLTHEENCDHHSKLPAIKFCRRECHARWVFGPFGECSASCGGGFRTRQVICLKGHVPSDECDANHKPLHSQECNYHSCPVVCPISKCSLWCQYGYQIDDDGCQICLCVEIPQLPELPCESSLFGCCPDGVTSAESFGPDRCRQADPRPSGSCFETPYGCCPDGLTAAQGVGGLGCEKAIKSRKLETGRCLESEEGSGDVTCESISETRVSCHETQFLCCPDGVTPASGPHYEGCPGLDCGHSQFGCCEDGVTAAHGANGYGCPEYIPRRPITPTRPCVEHFYGCCIDGVSLAQGPEFEGCPEGEAPKIHCIDTEYGCCLDRETPASGPHHAGCPIEHRKKGICFLPSESGTCQNHTIMWYYDSLIGECSRFWYSGCGTNGNLFESEEDCKAVCITPPDHDKCFLPKVVGRCRASIPKFFYNVDTQSCESFSYGGCGENANNFDSLQACDLQCTIPLTYNVCQLPPSKGPCSGNYAHWYFDQESKRCQQFYYGGCLGNENRFESYEDCERRCVGPITEVCSLEPDSGPCNSVIPFWHFNSTTDTCERFYYGGCHGNLNRFTTKQKCLNTCLLPKKESHSICNLPQEFGFCSGYFDKWFFDSSDGYCKKFVYSGCGGTLNRFDSEVECRTSCKAKEPVSDDVCSLPWNTGPCTDYTIMYYFNKDHQVCDRFYYGGCDGNANRYLTEEECLAQCGERKHVQPSAVDETRETSDDRGPGHDDKTSTHTDTCALQYDAGPCFDYTIRFYFDAGLQACNRFYYGGCEGNQNNFESEEACLQRCRREETKEETRVDTPDTPDTVDTVDTTSRTAEEICALPYETGSCSNYTILFYYSSEYKTCLRFYYGGCNGNPNRFSSEEECTQFCSPKTSDVTVPKRCSLPAEHGPCQSQLARWHFDHETRTCRMFRYGGCDGNKNRFMTEQSCLKSCHPDHFDRRSVDYSAESKDTDLDRLETDREGEGVPEGDGEPHQPPQTGVTHKVSDEELSVTHRTDTCQQPSEPGSCSNWEIRWYYDSSLETCMQFWYGGCEGNDNKFHTSQECEAVCTATTPAQLEPHPAPHLDHTGDDVCYLPSSAGPCDNFEIKWYHDSTHKQCIEFYYGGCEGNANRFETKEECQRQCQHDQVHDERTKIPIGEYCTQPHETGNCEGHELKFYWDDEQQQCRPFHYTGCHGNQNNFESANLCYQHCGINVREENRLAYTRESCSLPKDLGTCYEFVIRYYFDAATSDCVGFYFGGCDGNSNNFLSYEDCRAICRPEPKQRVCPPCDFSCSGQLRYDHDENGCMRCYCVDHESSSQQQHHHHQQQQHHHHQQQQQHQQNQVVLDTGKQLHQAFEYSVFTCHGQIEPGYSVMVERDGNYVAGVIARDYRQAQVSFNATESGTYKCVVQLPGGHSFESAGVHVTVYNVFLNASMDHESLILTCDGFGLDEYSAETYATFKKVDEDNRILFEQHTSRPALSHKLLLSLDQDLDHSGKYICELHSRQFNFSSNYALVTIRLHGSPDADLYYHGEQSGGFTQPVHDHALPNEFDDSGAYFGRRESVRVKLRVESRDSEVMFKCRIQGIPRNDDVLVRWERNNREIYSIPDKVPDEGLFQMSISNSDLDDSATYLCTIEHQGRTYSSAPLNLQKVVPGQITLHAYKQLVDEGEILRVDCTAGVTHGTPMTLEGGGHVQHPASTSFILGSMRAEFAFVPQNSKSFKCVAHLGRGLSLDSPKAWILLKHEIKAKLSTEKTSYSSGSDADLRCDVVGIESYEREFNVGFKHFVPTTGEVLAHYSQPGTRQNLLKLTNIENKQGGHYQCEVTFPDVGFKVASNTIRVDIKKEESLERSTISESSCTDMPAYADCNLVVKARFCGHHYFQKFCCRSCRNAGLI